jgi:hypothetical protein
LLRKAAFLLSFFSLTPLFSAEWTPVDPEDLAAKSPKVEKDAHAEVILWEVRVSDENTGGNSRSIFTHYLKIKVFDERGAEMISKVDIPYVGRTSVNQIAGRTTKADGTVIELKKDAVFDRMLVKLSGVKLKAKSFVLPGVEPRSVVEYRWYERHEDQLTDQIELQFQREIPVQTVRYFVKPLTSYLYSMRTMGFHLPPGLSFAKEPKGFSSLTVTNMPAFHEEPYMPPEHEVKAWMLVYYAKNWGLAPDKYWKDYGREVYTSAKLLMKVDGEVKKTAVHVIEDATAPDEKLRRLFRFCRNSIKNVSDPASGLSLEERSGRKANKVPADTIRASMGTGLDIDLLFGALATAAGFDARFAKMADRGQFFFNHAMAQAYFMQAYEVAVKLDDHWKFFDPASTYVPFGMLRWQEEGTEALITDPDDPVFVTTPMSEPAKSATKRTGSFRLSDSGTLEGDVRLEYTGHAATGRRRDYQEQQEEQQQDHLQKILTGQFAGAEVTSVQLQDVGDPDRPLSMSYHIKVPDYAQRTGKRFFLPIVFFQRNRPAMFTASERKFAVYFSYPWMETDEVYVTLPEGYELENPEMPAQIPIQSVGSYKLVANYDKAGRKLHCTRELVFGNKGSILFPAAVYPAVKKTFDLMHQSDEHLLTLKQAQPAGK